MINLHAIINSIFYFSSFLVRIQFNILKLFLIVEWTGGKKMSTLHFVVNSNNVRRDRPMVFKLMYPFGNHLFLS